MTRLWAIGLATVSLLGLANADAGAQSPAYPAKPVRLIVPSAPAGGADIAGRVIAKRLAEQLGQPIVVENRAGAAGNIAAEQVARMAPDGYNILMGAIAPLAISPGLYKSLPYDPVRDFAPITMGVVLSNVLVANASVPANNAHDLLALARAKPRSLNFGSSGNATLGHLAGELFASIGNVDIVHVPYKGGGPAMNDLLSGQIQLIFASPPTAIPHIRSGRIKPLAVTTARRLSALPDVPTLAETVMPGYEATNWYCFVAPARTPADIVSRLNQEIVKAMAHPEVREALLAQGMEPTPSTPDELGAFIRSEIAKWGKVIRERRIAPD